MAIKTKTEFSLPLKQTALVPGQSVELGVRSRAQVPYAKGEIDSRNNRVNTAYGGSGFEARGCKNPANWKQFKR